MVGFDKEIRMERTRPAVRTHQIASRLREQMHSFLGNLSAAVPRKTSRRFVCEALQGILARKSLRLSEIARSLNEAIPPDQDREPPLAPGKARGARRLPS